MENMKYFIFVLSTSLIIFNYGTQILLDHHYSTGERGPLVYLQKPPCIGGRYVCDVCNKTFSSVTHRSRHLASVHKTGVQLKCPHCDVYQNSRKDSVRKHLTNCHGLGNLTSCSLCGMIVPNVIEHVLNKHLVNITEPSAKETSTSYDPQGRSPQKCPLPLPSSMDFGSSALGLPFQPPGSYAQLLQGHPFPTVAGLVSPLSSHAQIIVDHGFASPPSQSKAESSFTPSSGHTHVKTDPGFLSHAPPENRYSPQVAFDESGRSIVVETRKYQD